jgi:carbon monoxide dehydrogenase subunit G
MIIEQSCTIPVAVDRLWDFMLDVPAVSRCLPGVDEFVARGDDQYGGAMRVKVGPISIRLEGRITVEERHALERVARMTAEGRDPRIPGSVKAKLTIRLVPASVSETELHLHADAAVLGKLGEFGQPVIKKSADRIVEHFTRNIAREMASR